MDLGLTALLHRGLELSVSKDCVSSRPFPLYLQPNLSTLLAQGVLLIRDALSRQLQLQLPLAQLPLQVFFELLGGNGAIQAQRLKRSR